MWEETPLLRSGFGPGEPDGTQNYGPTPPQALQFPVS